MTSERAFWKALAVGTIISLAVWGGLFALTPRTAKFLLPNVLGALLTLVVVVPLIFRHYRRENLPLRKEKLQQLLFSGIVWITVGVAFGVDSYFSDQSVTGRGLLFRYGVALLWTIAGINNLAKALRLRRSNDSASIS